MAKEEKVLVDEIVATLDDLHGKVNSVRGKRFADIIQIVSEILPDVLKQVEELGDKLSSADKKELAIEACLKYCNIKYLPEAAERKIIGYMIDGSISMLNKWFGKDWLEKISKVASTVWGWFKKVFGSK